MQKKKTKRKQKLGIGELPLVDQLKAQNKHSLWFLLQLLVSFGGFLLFLLLFIVFISLCKQLNKEMMIKREERKGERRTFETFSKGKKNIY